jgi:hypothetical protein
MNDTMNDSLNETIVTAQTFIKKREYKPSEFDSLKEY